MQLQSVLRGAMAATALATVMTAPAQAAIVVFSTPLAIPNNIDGLYINLVTGESDTAPVTGWDINPYSAAGSLAFFYGAAANPDSAGMLDASGTAYASLAESSLVSASASFSQAASSAFASAFTSPGTHFLGVRFQNEQTGQVNFGYMQFQVGAGSTTGFPLTLVGWAYENTGAGINVAAIPEPGTYALMLAGLAGIAGFAARRRKSA